MTWTNVPVGDYTLTAVATDNGNLSQTSDPVRIVVATTLLSDNFDGSALDSSKWNNSIITGTQDTSVALTQVGGELQIGPLKQGTAGSHYNGMSTVSSFDFTGAYAMAQVGQMPSTSSTGDAMFSVVLDGSNHYRMFVENGLLTCEKKIGNVKTSVGTTITFNPTAHAYWRVRHDQMSDHIVYEVSSDGYDWAPLASVAREFAVSALKVEWKAGTYQSEGTAPGTVSLEQVRIIRDAPIAPPDTVLLNDDFTGSTLNSDLWSVAIVTGTQDTSIPVGEASGALTIGPLYQTASGSHYNGVTSLRSYDMTGGYGWVRVAALPNSSGYGDAMFSLAVNGASSHYRIFVEHGTLTFEKRISGTKTTIGSTAYDSSAHAFWRIRHRVATDDIVFETAAAAGGIPGTWVVRATVARELTVTAMRFELKGGTYQTEGVSPGSVTFDNARFAKQ
jgi:hypothetical protein